MERLKSHCGPSSELVGICGLLCLPSLPYPTLPAATLPYPSDGKPCGGSHAAGWAMLVPLGPHRLARSGLCNGPYVDTAKPNRLSSGPQRIQGRQGLLFLSPKCCLTISINRIFGAPCKAPNILIDFRSLRHGKQTAFLGGRLATRPMCQAAAKEELKHAKAIMEPFAEHMRQQGLHERAEALMNGHIPLEREVEAFADFMCLRFKVA